ncbi:MAG: TetR/AcrR family transcriptional regulator [Solirubrobacteraceae bacterium]
MTSASEEIDRSDVAQRHALRDVLIPAVERMLAGGTTYPEITVSQLTDEAGISRWRFYRHFRDKHDLLRAWFEQLNAQFESDHDAWLHIEGTPPFAELRAAIASLFVPYGPHSALHGAMYDSASADPVIAEELEVTERRRIASLRAHIERGQRGGWIDSVLLPQETAEWIILTGSRSYQRMVVHGQVPVDRFVDVFSDYAWRVLYEPAR